MQEEMEGPYILKMNLSVYTRIVLFELKILLVLWIYLIVTLCVRVLDGVYRVRVYCVIKILLIIHLKYVKILQFNSPEWTKLYT